MFSPLRVVPLGCIVVLAAAFSLTAAPFHAAEAAQDPVVQAASTGSASPATDARAFLDRHCVACHNDRLRTANLLLDEADVAHIGAGAATWEKVVGKLRSGAMPPAGRRRPEPVALDSFVTWLENELDSYAAAHPNPGRVADHRLNRYEYGNAIRDLLALEIDTDELLPADESDQGFDNIAEVLSMSPTLLGRYMFAARRISQLAVGDPTIGPAVETFNLSRGLRQDERMNEGLPYGTRGGTLIRHYFPLDGEYLVKIRLGRNFTNSRIRAIRTREEIDVLLDGALVTRFTIGGECNDADSDSPLCTGSGIYRTSPYHLTADDTLEVRFSASAGMHDLGVAFVRKSVLTEGMAPTLLPPRHTSSTYEAPRMDVDTVRLEGPFDPTGPGDTPSRQRIFTCRPAGEADAEPCAREILGTLARRAYRRPVTDADIDTLLQFYRSGYGEGGFERGIQEGLARLLVSPQFLFRIERDPAQLADGGVYEISDLELASRLSFFLWSSIPDDELLAIAADGKLRDPGVLGAQVRRMLADPRAAALARNFGGQWLYIRNLQAVDPDASAYPEFDDNLREAFQRETELFIESQMRDDRPLTELLTADYSYLNERLARFYGVRNVYGAHFRRVALRDPNRAGLLGHGSVLTVTSYATRTSPVVRGKYPARQHPGRAAAAAAAPTCRRSRTPPATGTSPLRFASSWRRIAGARPAPPATCGWTRWGFALENFDGIGRWRDMDGPTPIDASGVLPDGTAFDGPVEFREALLDRSGEFVRTFAEKLLTYALGRPVQHYDIPAVRSILRDAAAEDHRWSSLVLGIVGESAVPDAQGARGAGGRRTTIALDADLALTLQ